MPVTRNIPERRRYVRVSPSMSNPVQTTIQDEELRLEALPVKDISLGGVAVELPEHILHLPVGRQISTLQIFLPKLGTISASGVIRRFEVDPVSRRRICAVEFTRVPVPADRKLYQYINRRQREIHWFTTETTTH